MDNSPTSRDRFREFHGLRSAGGRSPVLFGCHVTASIYLFAREIKTFAAYGRPMETELDFGKIGVEGADVYEDAEATIDAILRQPKSDTDELLNRVLSASPATRSEIVDRLRHDPAGRRWLRRLLPHLDQHDRRTLARELLEFDDDFAPSHRDSTMSLVIEAVSVDDLLRTASWVAGSNAAGALWRRLADAAPERVAEVALDVLRRGRRLCPSHHAVDPGAGSVQRGQAQ